MERELRLWKIYAAISSVAIVILLVSAFTIAHPRTKFRAIDVQRINVVEPDGTLRMVISDKAQFPGAILHGHEYPHPDRVAAGMLFYNDEGTENGGLIFGGGKEKDGIPTSYGHLSFDNYDQDQVFTVDAEQQGNRKGVGLAMVDRPSWPLTDLLNLPRSQWKHFIETHPQSHQRFFLGSENNRATVLQLKDPQGRNRLVIQVGVDGKPVIQFLDASGKVTSQLPPAGAK